MVKKFSIRVRCLGLDRADKSTRDVVYDVSKYIYTISIILNAVLRRTEDNPDMTLSLYFSFAIDRESVSSPTVRAMFDV